MATLSKNYEETLKNIGKERWFFLRNILSIFCPIKKYQEKHKKSLKLNTPHKIK